MKRHTKRDVHSVLKEHARRRSIDELAREGTRHIRVLSGEKILELLQAIVDDSIAESGHLDPSDRERLISESKQQFERFAREQAGADQRIGELQSTVESLNQQLREGAEASTALSERLQAVIEAHDDERRDATTRHSEELTRLQGEVDRRDDQIVLLQEQLRHHNTHVDGVSTHVRELEQQDQQLRAQLNAAESRSADLTLQLEAAELRVARQPDVRQMEERLATARATVESYDREITRLLERVKEDERVILDLRSLLANKENELRGSEEQTRQLAVEAEVGRRNSGVDTLKTELAAMRQELAALSTRPDAPDTEALQATLQSGLTSLVAEMAQRESRTTEALEARFGETLDKTLDKIGKTVRSATAGPVDRPVEATDALIGKVFDDSSDLDSNYGELGTASERSTKGISRSLERLRAMRQGAASGPSAE